MKQKTDIKQKVLALMLTIAALAVGHTTAMAETVTYTLTGSTSTNVPHGEYDTSLTITASGDVTGSVTTSWSSAYTTNVTVGLPGGITLSFGTDLNANGLRMSDSFKGAGLQIIGHYDGEGGYFTLAHASKYIYHVTLKSSMGSTTDEVWNLMNSYTKNKIVSKLFHTIIVEYATVIPMTDATIKGLSGVTPVSSVNATLPGRTLYKDGEWNTLCLPFDIADISGTPLEGATVKTLESASLDNTTGELTLNFSDNLTAIEAGTPYIIKWAKATDYVDDDAHNIVNPVFNGVTIDKTAHNKTCDLGNDKSISFVGNYSPVVLQANDNTKLYLGSNSNLYFPGVNITINAFRAYFQMTGITAGTVTNARMNFGDVVNAITGVQGVQGVQDNSWYTLDGRKVSTGQMPKGIYIHNGRKEVIK